MTEEKIHHRGRINATHVDHFVEFIDRPCSSQDVSYGIKFLNLNSGETIEIPNVVRTVKRSAMISQYIQFCQEEKFEPLSRTTLFKILEVRQASQRKSLQGLDNTATDGSAGFQKIEMIVDDLEKGGMNRQWCAEVKERLRSRKRHLKTNYRVYRNTEEGLCLIIAASSLLVTNKIPTSGRNAPINTQKTVTSVKICEMSKMKMKINFEVLFKSLTVVDGLLYDFKLAQTDIFEWKSHNVRSVNQEATKQDQLKTIGTNPNCALVIMDWAMKFLQISEGPMKGTSAYVCEVDEATITL